MISGYPMDYQVLTVAELVGIWRALDQALPEYADEARVDVLGRRAYIETLFVYKHLRGIAAKEQTMQEWGLTETEASAIMARRKTVIYN